MKNHIKHLIIVTGFLVMIIGLTDCKKLVMIPPPVGTITASQVFATDKQATSAMAGVYSAMINGYNISFSSGALTVFSGMSADELEPFDSNPNDGFSQFRTNKLLQNNSLIYPDFWAPGYFSIYGANAVIEGLNSSATVHDDVKNELIGEAEFIRAFNYFYLVNLFGSVPLVTTIDYNKTALLARAPSSDIYQQIIADLTDAQKRLPADYSVGSDQRIIPNRWAATALLARVYLYQGKWPEAEAQSTAIINNSNLYKLADTLNGVFLVNSPEAIWQLQQNSAAGSFNATVEGYALIPFDHATQPYTYLTNSLLNSFEKGDQRKIAWIDSTQYGGATYYYPFKYKTGRSQVVPNGIASQYYMMLRLAEQYLIRAEARANLNENGAVADLNAVRKRAELSNTNASTKNELLSAIAHERQIEFFAEWGHRWLDLKRTGQATTVLSANKGVTVSQNSLLYPIPISELSTDPNLTQNPGY